MRLITRITPRTRHLLPLVPTLHATRCLWQVPSRRVRKLRRQSWTSRRSGRRGTSLRRMRSCKVSRRLALPCSSGWHSIDATRGWPIDAPRAVDSVRQGPETNV